MKKTNLLRRFFLLSIGLLLFASNNYTTTTIAQDKIPPSIILRTSRTMLTIPCPPGMKSNKGCCDENNNSIELISEIKNSPAGSNWNYRYEITGGRIIGFGAKVKMDLLGVKPGTYTVTVYATTSQKENPAEIIISDTVKVTLENCPNCRYPHSCPKISIKPSENSIKAGEKLIFIGLVEIEADRPTYNWTVSAGVIIKGQRTNIIYVDTSGLEGQELTATLEVGGGLSDCNNTATSSSVKIK